MTVPAGARIFEQGYRRYDGARLGPWAAVRSLWAHTVQRILGLRRSARHKVLPFLTIALAYLPAIAFIGFIALIPKDANGNSRLDDIIPTYAEYFGYVTAVIVLFIVFAAPEALCPDRRNRSLSLYLASPLSRDTYLLAKALAVFSVLCLVTVGPQLLLLIGYVLQNHGPDGPVGVLAQLGRILGAGASVAVFGTAFALAVASLSDRKGLATGGALIALLGSQVASDILAFPLALPKGTLMLSLFRAPFEVAQRILAAPAKNLAAPDVATGLVLVAALAWIVLFGLVVYLRYARLQVTR